MRQIFYTLFVSAALATTARGADRNPAWAAKLERAGLPNLHRVTPNLYRCAQPTADGLRAAEAMGIKTVVSLRAFHSDNDEVESTKLRTRRIYFNTWHAEDEDVVRFLKIISDTNAGPILVHCKHGADRTGTMIAIYRMAVQGWTKEEAIKEMTTGDFGYHTVWRNLIRYLKALNVGAMRKQAGITFTPTKRTEKPGGGRIVASRQHQGMGQSLLSDSPRETLSVLGGQRDGSGNLSAIAAADRAFPAAFAEFDR